MLYKRSKKPGAYWWVRFESEGVYIRQSSGTDSKERAQTFERELRKELWNAQKLGIEVHTWEEACARWLKEKAHKRSLKRDVLAFRSFKDQMAGRDLADIDGETIGRLGSTNGRNLAALRSLLQACVRWGWLDRAPKVEMPHVEKHDPRWITKEEFETLCKELPPHASALARFGVGTGLRQRNIFRLRWADVDVRQKCLRVGSKEIKTGKSISVPLNGDALAVLRQQQGKHAVFVFTDHASRAPVGSIKTCWLKAVKRAGLEGVRFHDLRHTWAAWHVLAGTPPIILKELGGWASLAMVEKYGHIGTSHLADWADNSRVVKRRRKR